MADRKRILLIFGTRPETIKMAPVWRALRELPDVFDARTAVTAQHRHMLDQALSDFNLTPEFDLDIMRDNQDLFHITCRAIEGMKAILDSFQPHCILVQGDTTTTFAGALAAFYKRIMIGHVEAGLRTYDKYSPYPEEINRRLTGCMADLHFAPTERARVNLLSERIPTNDIQVTGNTGIDALLWILANRPPSFERVLPPRTLRAIEGRFILVTTHRRESFGAPLVETLKAINDIAVRFPDIGILCPVHPNPNVKAVVHQFLGTAPNVHLIEPLDYVNFSHLMNRAEIVLTDSGGVQEEAPSLLKPVLVLRETTERPEGIEAGVAKLVGTNRDLIIAEVCRLLMEPAYRLSMTGKSNPYGDGRASERIVATLAKRLAMSAIA